jgi:hypothetical protein
MSGINFDQLLPPTDLLTKAVEAWPALPAEEREATSLADYLAIAAYRAGARHGAEVAKSQQVAPSDEELNGMWDAQDFKFPGVVANFGRAVLARYGSHPAPVPVGERLPGKKDCHADGWCWMWEAQP